MKIDSNNFIVKHALCIIAAVLIVVLYCLSFIEIDNNSLLIILFNLILDFK